MPLGACLLLPFSNNPMYGRELVIQIVLNPSLFCNVGFDALGDEGGVDNLKRHTGIIVVQLFAPRNVGTSTIRLYADYASSLFDGRKFSDVVCGVASIETIGTDDIWHQINVNIPYWRDE